MTFSHTPTAPRHKLPVEIWQLVLDHFEPTKETYVVDQPWKRTASESTLAALTQVCWRMRCIALPIVWKYVYLETMEEWGLLWKRISPESGQHICAFINFWTVPDLPPLAMDDVESYGKDMLWYAFADRNNLPIGHREHCRTILKSGPDYGGFKSVIKSAEMYRQACKEVSGMWSRKLRTIYWDASTSFSEDVILNIRRIQETSSSYKDYPGLQSLWIDFFEEKQHTATGMLRLHWTFSEFEPAALARLLGVARYMSFRSSKADLINGYSDYLQRMTADTGVPRHGERAVHGWDLSRRVEQVWVRAYTGGRVFKWLHGTPPFEVVLTAEIPTEEPVWKLGKKTLGQLKFFSICPPHWPVTRRAFNFDLIVKGCLDIYPPDQTTVPPLRRMDTFSQVSGPGRLLSTLRHLRPQIFFSMSEAPFQCKELLPCWTRVRCIHIFENFTLNNSEEFANLDLVRDSHFFRPMRSGQNTLFPTTIKRWVENWGGFAEIDLVRAAIQLRPTLEHLYQIKGLKPLSGDDVSSYAKSDVEKISLRWTEDWQYRQPWCKSQRQQAVPVNSIGEVADDLHPIYKEWLCDPKLAYKVAQSFNEGIGETAAEYPFRHPIYYGMLHEETSACSLQDTSEIWLDRHWARKHQYRRDCYPEI